MIAQPVSARARWDGGVVTVEADGLADDVPVLLLNPGAVVLVPGAGPGEREVLLLASPEKLPVE